VTLRSVVGAIRRSEAIEVKYQSLSSPEPRWRWIAPHAIAFDGFRWHTRAFCLTDKAFKDFLLSRMLEIRECREGGRTHAFLPSVRVLAFAAWASYALAIDHMKV